MFILFEDQQGLVYGIVGLRVGLRVENCKIVRRRIILVFIVSCELFLKFQIINMDIEMIS